MKSEVSRAELYELVWAMPMGAIGKRFGVSDAEIGDICRSARIPMPPQTFWAKRAAGEAPDPRMELPARPYGAPELFVIGPDEPWKPPENEEDIPLPPPLAFSETLDEVRERALREIGKVPTPRGLRDPHPMISRALSGRRQTPEKKSGTKTGKPDSFVTRKRVFLNALLRVLDGFQAHCIPEPDLNRLAATIGRINLRFELGAGVDREGDRFLFVKLLGLPSGLGVPVEWADNESAPLEQQVPEVAAGFPLSFRSGFGSVSGFPRSLNAFQEVRELFVRRPQKPSRVVHEDTCG